MTHCSCHSSGIARAVLLQLATPVTANKLANKLGELWPELKAKNYPTQQVFWLFYRMSPNAAS